MIYIYIYGIYPNIDKILFNKKEIPFKEYFYTNTFPLQIIDPEIFYVLWVRDNSNKLTIKKIVNSKYELIKFQWIESHENIIEKIEKKSILTNKYANGINYILYVTIIFTINLLLFLIIF